jgi:multidrug resistance efflux pump
MTTDFEPYYPTRPRSSLIYILGVGSIVFLLALLPWVRVPVTVLAPAFIRAASEMHVVRTAAGGRIVASNLSENKKVEKGDWLVTIESDRLAEERRHLREKLLTIDRLMADVTLAINSASVTTDSTYSHSAQASTPLYRQAIFNYEHKLSEARTRRNKTFTDYNRQRKLFQQQVISLSEFENFQYDLRTAGQALTELTESQRGQWQGELKGLVDQKNELLSELIKNQKESDLLTISSPVSGTIQNIAGVYPGSFVNANQDLARISPDTSIIAVTYVSPADIGLIRANMVINLQVHAFPYNQWGLIRGKVLSIPQDITWIDNKPVFEVRCGLEKNFLQLKNGYRGFLLKGMSATVRFVIAERSLWQLLYDKVDDWINPNLKQSYAQQ